MAFETLVPVVFGFWSTKTATTASKAILAPSSE